jgi:hypothetical protein
MAVAAVPIATALGASAGTAATIGTIASVVSAVSTIAGVASNFLGGQAESQTYYAQAAASDFNAGVNEQDAAIAADQEKAELAKLDRERRIRAGKITAQSGGTGNALDVLADNAAQDELDILTTKYNTKLTQRAFLNNAQLDRLSASGARTSAKLTTGASILKGTASLGAALSDKKGGF